MRKRRKRSPSFAIGWVIIGLFILIMFLLIGAVGALGTVIGG